MHACINAICTALLRASLLLLRLDRWLDELSSACLPWPASNLDHLSDKAAHSRPLNLGVMWQVRQILLQRVDFNEQDVHQLDL